MLYIIDLLHQYYQSIALKMYKMLQSITSNQVDNGSNGVSRLGLEGISNCSKVLDV
jgi:hypothetical protein